MTDKPPYRVPLMAEIAALPPNGFKAISTFAGAGGSSLGYRMAGFRVAWASEFIDAARKVYEDNARPGTIVDGRDIRLVDPLEVLKAIDVKVGELDVLDGSPPCSSFSTAGKRESGWGEVRKYSDKEQRTDDLFFEYVRFIKEIKPKVFVAENVSGLVKGTAKGYFIEILRAMKACGYRVEAQLLDAQWLGVPQARQRIIFQGVREDLDLAPAFPTPFAYRYSVRDALPWIGAVGTSKGRRPGSEPAPTIVSHGRQATQPEMTAIDSVKIVPGGRGNRRRREEQRPHSLNEPLTAVLADGGRKSDCQFMIEPESDISRFAIGREADRLNPGQQSDKYFSLVRAPLDGPSPTVTAAGGGHESGNSIASVIHPTEKRKFSIGELKRICAFPDDFALSGTYAQQWERLGRAVPPLMMKAIAEAVRDHVLALAATKSPRLGRGSRASSTNAKRPMGAGKARTSRSGDGAKSRHGRA